MAKRLEIHPSIGICRVGTSPTFFLGPGPGHTPPARYRDGQGQLLRQAAQFRIFDCDRDQTGRLVSATEVTAAQARIEWTVHLANRKGVAEVFPPSLGRRSTATRRNARVRNRDQLIIDPGPRTLNTPGTVSEFDSGSFMGVKVPLGSARMERDGRLTVVGGFGHSGFFSRNNKPVPISDFANNDNWYDDMSDGVVRATVTRSGQPTAVAEPAWVIVAPPDFAPEIYNFVTMYDIAVQAAVDRGWLAGPDKPSFQRDVLPILERAVRYRWVFELAQIGHAPGRPGDFMARLSQLADPAAPQAPRAAIVGRLRNPNQPGGTNEVPGAMPRLHTHDVTTFVLRPTPTQWTILEKWQAGNFVNDLGQTLPSEPAPDALDRMALQACSGGPFYPGIEAGPIMAGPANYMAPFRLDAATLAPGQITGGNAVPWQADFLACREEMQVQLGWWPAQRPDKVFAEATPNQRASWARGVSTYEAMVTDWHRLGIVVARTDTQGNRSYLETERTFPG
jgi:hypothetical protein